MTSEATLPKEGSHPTTGVYSAPPPLAVLSYKPRIPTVSSTFLGAVLADVEDDNEGILPNAAEIVYCTCKTLARIQILGPKENGLQTLRMGRNKAREQVAFSGDCKIRKWCVG